MDNPVTVSEVLALRDGEPLDPRRVAELEADAQAQSLLAELRALRNELHALPEIEPPPWASVAARAQPAVRPARWQFKYPMASAAAVVLAALVGVASINPFGADPVPGTTPAATSALDTAVRGPEFGTSGRPTHGLDGLGGAAPPTLARLVSRSQDLQSQVRPGGLDRRTSSELILLLRITDIDEQIFALDERRALGSASAADEAERERLWAKRVDMLASLNSIQQQPDTGLHYATY